MDQLEELANRIDVAMDNCDASSLQADIDHTDQKLLEDPSPLSSALLNYFRANAYSALRQLNPDYQDSHFRWQQPEATEEILSLRRARKSVAFDDLDLVRRAQILTNLGNAFDIVGRPIEAISSWNEALALVPNFAMAAGNRAHGFTTYSADFYDPGHQCVFLGEAQKSYQTALSADAVWDSGFQSTVADQFAAKLGDVSGYINKRCKLDDFDPYGFSLGQTPEERLFNQWRLDNRLFLNPLNDLDAWPVAAQDVFHLPTHTYSIAEEPRFVKFYDLLKQEYAAACVLLWEGVERDEEDHPADRSSLMFEHYDYSVSNISLEKQKAAMRLAYSLLDKTAVFINDFFNIGKDPKRVSFRNVWFSDRECTQLHTCLSETNWRLRGLYSLSLDIYDKDMKELASPLAVRANDVRNAIEHRFLSVHDYVIPENKLQLCDYITTKELYELSLHVIRLARSGIMGLSLAIHHHEKQSQKDEEKNLLPVVSSPRRPFGDDEMV